MAIRWEKLTVKSQQAMEQAQTALAHWAIPNCCPCICCWRLVEDREGVIPAVLEKIGVPTERLETELHQIEEKLPRVAGAAAQPSLSQALNKVFDQAFARRPTSKTSTSPPSICCSASPMEKATPRSRRSPLWALPTRESSRASPPCAARSASPTRIPKANFRLWKSTPKILTELARRGKLDPVIGRDEEIRRVIQVLSRRTKNNPVLIGEPGVGKNRHRRGARPPHRFR